MPRSKPVLVGLLCPCLLALCTLLLGTGLRAEDREQWQQPDRVMSDLHLRPGTRIADVGCGTGYFTFRLAKAVGPKGKVFALDVSSDALKPVREGWRGRSSAASR